MTPNNIPYKTIKDPPVSEADSVKDGCTATGYHYADISVPLELKPNAKIGDPEVNCCGEPSVECRENKCGNICEVIVRQRISVSIPIHYDVDVSMGESEISCDGDSCCR